MPGALSAVLDGSATSTAPQLVLIADSLLQPGLLLLRQVIANSLARNESVVVLALEQTRSRLLPTNLINTSKVDFVDACSPFPFASTSKLAESESADVHAEGGLAKAQTAVLEAIKRRRKDGGSVLVVVDSIDELADEGVHKAYAFVRNVLKELEGISGARLATIHHSSYPPLPSPSTTLTPYLLTTLLSPSTSSSTLHFTLYPTTLLELLSREYGLSIPLSPTNPLDIRLTSFLQSFSSRSWGSPFIRPESSKDEDERQMLDLGGRAEGGCVVEWSCRGVNVPGDGTKRGETKKVVTRGVEGLKRTKEGVEAVRLKDVLRADKMSNVAQLLTPTASGTSTPTTKPKTKAEDPPLPFNLSLTDSQKAARENVVLPYLPKEGEIEYVPDEGDDMDDDDPDEDLEI